MSQRTFLFAGLMFLGLSTFLCFPLLAESSNNSSRTNEPIITWNTESTTSTISPGQRVTISLQFTSSHDLRHVCVGVSRSLQSLLRRITPFSFDHVKAGETERIHVVIESRSSSAALGSIVGSIFLQKRERDEKALPNSTQLVINVWATQKDPSFGVELKLPPWGPIQIDSDSPSPGTITLNIKRQSGNRQISECGIVVYSNPNHESLHQWFEETIDQNGILIAGATFQEQELSGGSSALVLSQPIPRQYADEHGPVEEAYTMSPSGKVISIVQSQENDLFSKGFSQNQITAQLLQILGAVQVP